MHRGDAEPRRKAKSKSKPEGAEVAEAAEASTGALRALAQEQPLGNGRGAQRFPRLPRVKGQQLIASLPVCRLGACQMGNHRLDDAPEFRCQHVDHIAMRPAIERDQAFFRHGAIEIHRQHI